MNSTETPFKPEQKMGYDTIPSSSEGSRCQSMEEEHAPVPKEPTLVSWEPKVKREIYG